MAEIAAPRIILLETSGRTGHVAVALGDQLLAVRRIAETRRLARDLAPALRELLAEQGWQPRQVDLVVVSQGPGSYTGLRVGLISAKAFAYATGAAVVAVETFAVIAAQAPADVMAIEVFADAQQDRVYRQRFGRTDPEGRFVPQTALAILPFPRWLDDPDRALWVSGPGLQGRESRLPAGVQAVPAELREPQPPCLLALGLELYHRGKRADVWALEPLYLRPSAAEEQWAARVKPTPGAPI